jgi:hypothetical protein
MFKEKYGDVISYFHTIGLTDEQISSLKERLVGEE